MGKNSLVQRLELAGTAGEAGIGEGERRCLN